VGKKQKFVFLLKSQTSSCFIKLPGQPAYQQKVSILVSLAVL